MSEDTPKKAPTPGDIKKRPVAVAVTPASSRTTKNAGAPSEEPHKGTSRPTVASLDKRLTAESRDRIMVQEETLRLLEASVLREKGVNDDIREVARKANGQAGATTRLFGMQRASDARLEALEADVARISAYATSGNRRLEDKAAVDAEELNGEATEAADAADTVLETEFKALRKRVHTMETETIPALAGLVDGQDVRLKMVEGGQKSLSDRVTNVESTTITEKKVPKGLLLIELVASVILATIITIIVSAGISYKSTADADVTVGASKGSITASQFNDPAAALMPFLIWCVSFVILLGLSWGLTGIFSRGRKVETHQQTETYRETEPSSNDGASPRKKRPLKAWLSNEDIHPVTNEQFGDKPITATSDTEPVTTTKTVETKQTVPAHT